MILYPNTEKSMPLVSTVLMFRLLICIAEFNLQMQQNSD